VPAHEQKRFERGGVSVIRIPPSRVLGGVDPVVSVSDLDLGDVDVVHLHDTLPLLIRRTLTKGLRAGKPVVTTYHNDYIKKTATGRLLKRVRWALQGRRTLHASDARIVLTSHFEQLLRDKGVKGSLDVIPNGFSPVEDAAAAPAALADRDSNRPLLAFVGRLSEQKGVDVLMDAMDAFDDDPGFDLAIAGKGELSDWLDGRHAQAKCKDAISVLGLVSDAEKRWLYENATAVVIPSRFEGLPTVLLEAMHSGTPVVMTDVNGLGALVDEAGSGLSVPMEDPASLASAMTEVARADADRLAELGAGGVAASQSYLWSSVTDSVLEVYRRVVGR
jgi:glycosyltransferase involved in cell wall biosynthesis